MFFKKNQLAILPKAAVLSLPLETKILSTSIYGGGVRNDVTHIFNYDLKDENGQCLLTEENYEKELIAITKKLNLPLNTTVGMTTAVSISDTIIKTKESHGLAVTAIVTAGIENNGGCAGDPCGYIEENNGFLPSPGTINIMLGIDADLPDGILFRAAVTATEAKTAAIRELMLPSCYSKELATGSGTDGIIIAANAGSSLKRTDAGKHALLGELISTVLKEGVKEALLFHMEKSHTDMTMIKNRLKRFNINENTLENYILEKQLPCNSSKIWHKANEDKSASITIAEITALMDQHRWGHFNKDEILAEIKRLLNLTDLEEKDIDSLIFQWLIKRYQ